jgi:hypothetical protein
MRKLTAVCLTGVIGAALAAPASAGQVQRVTTAVLIFNADYADAPPGEDDFDRARVYGKVEAGKAKCAKFRGVTAFATREKGPDVRLGPTRTDGLGYWSVHTPFANVNFGELYAKAPRVKRGKRTVCKADRSPNIQVAF